MFEIEEKGRGWLQIAAVVGIIAIGVILYLIYAGYIDLSYLSGML